MLTFLSIYSAVNGHNDILSSGSPEFAERPASFSSSIALELGRLGSGGEFFLEIMRAYIHLILVIEYPGYTYRWNMNIRYAFHISIYYCNYTFGTCFLLR